MIPVSRQALWQLYGWIERIPGGTRENDGLETGIMGAAAARIAWLRCALPANQGVRPESVLDGPDPDPAGPHPVWQPGAPSRVVAATPTPATVCHGHGLQTAS